MENQTYERDLVNRQVLVIDDDKAVAECFQAVLTLAGMQVEIVHTAREGLVRLASSTPGLILLDMHLGKEISGEDILYQIRSNPRLDATRVIVVTGYPQTTQLITNLADLILLKPVGIDQLTTLARRMISLNAAPVVHSFRDPVTKLFNSEFFRTRLELAFERARRRPDFLYGVIEFQAHLTGEEPAVANHNIDLSLAVLNEISSRLRKNLRPTDTIARVSEWKFVSLHEDLLVAESIELIVERIQNLLADPYEWQGRSYQVEVHFGRAVAQPSYHSPFDILNAADGSLEQAPGSPG